ncbi:TonB-dependent receptor [Bacteroides sp. AN502(2024)]|uniref:TonB-dependent receptor n=1 Tax=Bacteroides sp. AN502(2024) TaxID=3160599 RepID=UPI003513D44B
MKALIFVSFILFSLSNIQAKDFTLQGRVIDTDKNIIVGATIQCLQHDSIFINGGTSDEKGNFSISLPHQGDYKLRISYIGYETNTSFLENIQNNMNVGDIILTSTSINLNEVAITARQVVRTTDKLTIFPTKQQLRHSVGGYEALAHLLIPTLDVDPLKKNISMKEGTVVTCINGRQATNTEINNINSGSILRIDFYDHGHPEHPDAYAVIDYILKQQDTGGTIAANGEQHLNKPTGNYDINGQFLKKNSEVTFYISDAYNNFNAKEGNYSKTLFIYPEAVLERKSIALPSKQWSNTLSSYLNYSHKTSKNIFYAALRYNTGKTCDTNNSIQEYNNLNSSLNVRDFSKTSNINPGIELSYNGKFHRKQTFKITLSSDYNHNEYAREYSELASSTSSITSKTKEDYFFLKILAIYTKTFKNNGTLSSVFIHYQNNSHTNQRANEMTNTEDYLHYNGTALYIAYQQNIQKMSFRFKWGNSLEIHKSKNNSKIQKLLLYPEINLNYQSTSNQNWQFTARYLTETPQMAWLTNTEQQIDPLQTRQGNPNLKNRSILETFISYSIDTKWMTLIPRMEYSPLFNDFYESVNRNNDTFIHSYQTGGTLQYICPDLTLNIKLVPQILTLNINTGWEKIWYKTWEKNKITNWKYNAKFLFIYKNFMASANINAPRKDIILGMVQKIPFSYRINLGYTHRNLNIQLNTRNPFSRFTKQTDLYSPNYSNHTDSYIPKAEDHVFYIKANYRFNFGRKHNFSQPNIENTTKSAILKAY